MKIICTGRNYRAHAEEHKSKLPKEPVFFMKPETAIIRNNLPFFYPEFSEKIHYEVELVLRICKLGKHISEKFAHTYYDQIGIGLDFTARDIQENCKKKGLPWEIAKAFDGSAAISNFVDKNKFKDLNNINFSLNLNGKTVQEASSSQMIFSFDQLISYLSKFVTLKIGDLIFTGTPSGVGEVKIGDLLEGYVEGEKCFGVKVK